MNITQIRNVAQRCAVLTIAGMSVFAAGCRDNVTEVESGSVLSPPGPVAPGAQLASLSLTSFVQFDQLVTPGFFAGSGNDNVAFTLVQHQGIELALRGKLRFDSGCQPQNIFNSNSDGSYSFAARDVNDVGDGCDGSLIKPSWVDGDTPEWSFEWSVNTDFDESTGLKLDDLTYEIGLDADPTLAGTSFLTFDPINVPYADHAIGNNDTTEDTKEVAVDAADYANLIATFNVAQQSWNYEFFDEEFPIDTFIADIPGYYDIYLKAFDNGVEVAAVQIRIVVGGGCSVTPNPVVVGGEYTLETEGSTSLATAPLRAGIYMPGDPGYDVPDACGELLVYDPDGGFVTGGGWLNTNPQALVWDQDFSVDDTGWFDSDDEWYGTIIMDGGVATFSGTDSGPFSRFDVYREIWPGTWTAEIDVFLDPSWPAGQGFDYSVASNGSDGLHQRDFIFHVGIVENFGPVSGKALLVNGSNNADFSTNPFKLVNDNGGAYFEVLTEGWYTLQHVFTDNGGQLSVDLNLLDSEGTVLWTATRTDASDIVPAAVGGNRYAWFTHIDVEEGIMVDNHRLILNELSFAEGRANFGFNAKYNPGATVPVGNTQFTFKAGELNFHANGYDWLVIDPETNVARYSGYGRINGFTSPTGEPYRVMVWAQDGDAQAPPAADTFRIRVWYEDGGDVVLYDNGPDQAIGGGQISVHGRRGPAN